MPVTSNLPQFSRAMEDLAREIEDVPFIAFDYIGDIAVRQIRSDAPVDKGKLRRGISKKKSGPRSVSIVSEAPYSAAVDKGHKTRQGTGTAPNYKPKPGGKTFVPANPFFTKTINKLQGDNGDYIKRVKIEADNKIHAVLSRYRLT